MRFEMPEEALAQTHPARVLWQVLGTFDLTMFVRGAKSVDGQAGRSTHCPRMMLCVWLYAVSRGIGSAREIERLVKSDRAFEWIAGGVPLSHDVLSNFRVDHGDALERLMGEVLGALVHKELVTLEQVAIDGTRVRAHASAPSFRRQASLHACLEQARLHTKAVLSATHQSTRVRAAAEAAARAFEKRVEAAIDVVGQLRAQGREKPRASTTDADARVMKMGDGGFRPAYNIQLAVAGSELGGPRTTVGVRVSQKGNDYDGLVAVTEDVHARTGKYPDAVLADGGFASHAGIDALAERGVRPIVSVTEGDKTSAVRKPSDAVAAWRDDMETEDAKRRYKARAGLVELKNGRFKKSFGLAQLLVRGVAKVTCVVLMTAIADNLLQHAAKLLA